MTLKDFYYEHETPILASGMILIIIITLFIIFSKQPESIADRPQCSKIYVGLGDKAGNTICRLDTDGWASCNQLLKVNESYRPIYGCD